MCLHKLAIKMSTYGNKLTKEEHCINIDLSQSYPTEDF